MNRKKLGFVFIFIGLVQVIWGQHMRLVLMTDDYPPGYCHEAVSVDTAVCYALEYVPKVTGVLTSYTALLEVTCTSAGAPVIYNRSCYMTDRSNFLSACGEHPVGLLVSAGNSGTSKNSRIQSGVPIYLHQVCFAIPKEEIITISPEKIAHLTTSVDLDFGSAVTEYVQFTQQTIGPRKKSAMVVTQSPLLDFRVIRSGHDEVEVDWTMENQVGVYTVVLERKVGGGAFVNVAERTIRLTEKGISVHQLKDKISSEKAEYRLWISDDRGHEWRSSGRVVE